MKGKTEREKISRKKPLKVPIPQGSRLGTQRFPSVSDGKLASHQPDDRLPKTQHLLNFWRLPSQKRTNLCCLQRFLPRNGIQQSKHPRKGIPENALESFVSFSNPPPDGHRSQKLHCVPRRRKALKKLPLFISQLKTEFCCPTARGRLSIDNRFH